MLKKFLIMISLMTAFNLMGQLRNRVVNSDTQPIGVIEKECKKDESGFCKSVLSGYGDEDDIDDPTVNEDGMECIEDYMGEQRTRSAADFEYLYGINLSDLIADVDYDNTSCLQLSILQENYQECRVRTDYHNGYCLIQCIPFYSQVSTTTVFTNEEDYNNYALDFNNNYYVPQGITKTRTGNLLISWYYWGIEGKYEKDSVIMKFDQNATVKKIVKVYPLPTDDFYNPPHVGGIAYTFYITKDLEIHNIIFVSDGYYDDTGDTYINIYEMTDTSLIYKTNKKLESTIKPDALGYGNGYLWVGRFNVSDPDLLNGYKITIRANPFSVIMGEETGGVSIPQISVKFPKPKIQGIHLFSSILTNPLTNGRLSFYFTKSYGDAQSYIYHGTLDINDVNGDKKINGIEGTEWKWESFYTPNGDGAFRKLPAGIEGIVEYNNELWVPNEGATAHYSYWNNNDGARELLKANPVNSGNDKLFPAGAVLFEGTSIDSNWGIKLVLVMAQNKQGNFYYSLGKLNYTSITYSSETLTGLIMNTEKPSSLNPINWQTPINQRASVYVEDIKAVYIMNLDNTLGDSDDWTLSKTDIIFDNNKNAAMNTNSTPYKITFDNIDVEIGDGTNDYKGFLTIFNSKHTLSDVVTPIGGIYMGVKDTTNYYTQYFYYIYYYANQCLLTNTFDYCFNTVIPDFIEANKTYIFCRLMEDNPNKFNDNMQRLTPIKMDCD